MMKLLMEDKTSCRNENDDLETESTSIELKSKEDNGVAIKNPNALTNEEFKRRAKDVFTKFGNGFCKDILPKLPVLPNGMHLLGVDEQSPLIDCGELYKIRAFRPDTPLRQSEVFEDNCTIRYTNLSRLINDDLTISKFKVELATFRVGPVENDQVGNNAIKGTYEAEDACNLTVKQFIERKVKELIMLSLEIAVTRKIREAEVRDLKERCLSRYGGKCNNGDDHKLCNICLVKDHVTKTTNHFESKGDKCGAG